MKYDPKAPPFWERTKSGVHTKLLQRAEEVKKAIQLEKEYKYCKLKAARYEADYMLSCSSSGKATGTSLLIATQLTELYRRMREIDDVLRIEYRHRRRGYANTEDGDPRFAIYAWRADGFGNRSIK